MINFADFSGAEKDVMMQLFVTGPTWDGNIIAKSGRDGLVEKGYACHHDGWAYLSTAGVRLAISDEVKFNVKGWADKRWYKKIIAA